MGKLCGVSVKIRNHFRESTSPKWLVNINEVTTLDSMPSGENHSAFILTDESSKIHKMYHQGLSQETVPDGLYVAKESDSICTIKATLNNTSEVDCIIDSGSQVVAISEAMAVKLGLSWDPCIMLKMVSANGQTDATLGLAKNVPVAIGSMTFVLQFHVIRNPSYEVLLGRPFDVLAKSEVKTQNKEQTVITITDPNTGEVLTVPTFPRDRPKGRQAEQDF
ncbi:hypothetical protein C0991_005717 [Blastosporella zonata]|nr:hypothetical protein C0991_005717 [Blastosporella zonata]